jgi:hypothetical protein
LHVTLPQHAGVKALYGWTQIVVQHLLQQLWQQYQAGA